MTEARRGGTAALTAAGVRGQLRRWLLHLYDTDAAFGAALITHWRTRARLLQLEPDWRSMRPLVWVDEPSGRAVRDEFESLAEGRSPVEERARVWDEAYAPVADYLDGLTELAERFGLDRLGMEGVDTIHAWCFHRQEVVASGGRWPRRRFSAGYQVFGPVIEVGDVIDTDLGVVDLHGLPFRVRTVEIEPILRIDGNVSRWDPASERRASAFARLQKRFGRAHDAEIRAELDRIAALAEGEGAIALDTRPNVARDLEWLFWHLRYREGPTAVATRAGLSLGDVAKVRQAVWRISRLADVRPYPSWSDRMAD